MELQKIKLDIVGRGNVATHLCKAFLENRNAIDVQIINPHTLDNLRSNADVILISVKDDAISEVSRKLDGISGIIAHTSGSTSLNQLQEMLPNSKSRCAVFYPLQTFSKDINLDYSEIPIFIEASDRKVERILSELASNISRSIHKADSDKRKILHIASVLACNFANHLLGMSSQILRENNIPNNLLAPLVKETLRKAMHTTDPYTVQTGPAIRHDNKIIESHLSYLEKYPHIQSIYSIITESIQQCHQ